MGIKAAPARSTLSDALNQRYWRIYHGLAQRLIARARALYAHEPSVLDLDASVYALDATTIDLCLSLFDWAPFRSTKAAIKLHTLLDLRGAIPAFIHISDGKLHDVNVLDILPVEAGAFYVMDRGYVDFECLYAMHQAGAFFVTRVKVGMDARRVYSAPTERATGVICDQRIMFNGFYSAKHYPEHLRRFLLQGPHVGQDVGLPDQQHRFAGPDDRRVVQEPLAGGNVLQVDQAAPAHQALPGYQRERGEDADLVRCGHLRADRHRQKGASSRGLALHLSTDPVDVGICENRSFTGIAARSIPAEITRLRQSTDLVRPLTRHYCVHDYVYGVNAPVAPRMSPYRGRHYATPELPHRHLAVPHRGRTHATGRSAGMVTGYGPKPRLNRHCEGVYARRRTVDRSRHGKCSAGSRETSFEIPIHLVDMPATDRLENSSD
jgi:hypothetical protein